MAESDSSVGTIPLPRSKRFINLTGQRFGRLVVVAFAGTKGTATYWTCNCDCGKRVRSESSRLRKGQESCGCLQREQNAARMTIHGHCKKPEFKVWYDMRRRCLDPKSPHYDDYGKRGIRVCERWLTFENFLADMGPMPTDRHSIERKNVNGDYEAGNCEWIEKRDQPKNRRCARMLTFNGRTQSLTDWARELKIHKSVLANRLRRGWSVDRTLSTPI